MNTNPRRYLAVLGAFLTLAAFALLLPLSADGHACGSAAFPRYQTVGPYFRSSLPGGGIQKACSEAGATERRIGYSSLALATIFVAAPIARRRHSPT